MIILNLSILRYRFGWLHFTFGFTQRLRASSWSFYRAIEGVIQTLSGTPLRITLFIPPNNDHPASSRISLNQSDRLIPWHFGYCRTDAIPGNVRLLAAPRECRNHAGCRCEATLHYPLSIASTRSIHSPAPIANVFSRQ